MKEIVNNEPFPQHHKHSHRSYPAKRLPYLLTFIDQLQLSIDKSKASRNDDDSIVERGGDILLNVVNDWGIDQINATCLNTQYTLN